MSISVGSVPQNLIKSLVPDVALPAARPTKDIASIAALIKASNELKVAGESEKNPHYALAKMAQEELKFVDMAANILSSKPSDAKTIAAVNLLRLQYGADTDGVLKFAEVLKDVLEQRAAAKQMELVLNSDDKVSAEITKFDAQSAFGY